MFVVRTVEDSADPICQFLSAEQSIRLNHLALAVYPLGLYSIEPRTLGGQKAAYDPHSICALFDFPVVRGDPRSDLFRDVPGSVVPDQHPYTLAGCLQLLAAPTKKERVVARSPGGRPRSATTPHRTPASRAITGNGLRIGIVFLDRLLHQAQGLARIAPAVKRRSRQPAEPGLVQESHDPLWAAVGEADQPVASEASLFFLRTRGQERLSSVWPPPSAAPSSPKWPGWFRR
jgi:hypothetical protein